MCWFVELVDNACMCQWRGYVRDYVYKIKLYQDCLSNFYIKIEN